MGAWGYMMRQSDDGLTAMDGLIVDANGVLDVDKNAIDYMDWAIKSTHRYYFDYIKECHETFIHVISEVVYELNMNNIDDLCGGAENREQLRNVKKIVASEAVCIDLINEMKAYLDFNRSDEGKEFWNDQNMRQDCIKYITKQLEMLKKIGAPRDVDKKIILFSKDKKNSNPILDFYKYDITPTSNDNLNRIRYFLNNTVNRDTAKDIGMKLTADIYSPSNGLAYYKITMRLSNGTQKLIAKDRDIDNLIMNTLKELDIQILPGLKVLTQSVDKYFTIWKYYYNMQVYKNVAEYKKSKKQA